MFPYSRSDGLSEQWKQLLNRLDPDQVCALGLSRPGTNSGVVNLNAPHREPAKPLVDRLGDELGRLVYTEEEEPDHFFTGTSTLLHSVLSAIGDQFKPPNSDQFVLVPSVSRYSPAYLPVMARYGGVNEERLNEALNTRFSHRYWFDLNISESVRLEERNIDNLRALAGDFSNLLEDDEDESRVWTLPELGLLGLNIRGSAESLFTQNRAGTREDDHYTPIVVTGTSDSVADFALYWNLRSEHYFAKPFPLWLPLELLENLETPGAIQAALRNVSPMVGKSRPSMEDVLIVSASTSTEELLRRLQSRYPGARIGLESLNRLFTATCEYSYTTEKTPVYFENGRASIQPPKPEELKKNLITGVDNVVYEAGVDGIWIPQGEAIAWHLGWPRFYSHDNISRRGNLRFIEQFNKEFSGRNLLNLRTPDGWSTLSSVFEERGYAIESTPQSSASLGQLELLGGIANLKVLSSSGVRKLLRELSTRRGKDREWLDERRTLKFDRFKEVLGDGVAHDILRWLVEKRIVFRGSSLKCPKCAMESWYPIDRIQELWHCDGCQEDSPTPLNLSRTDWSYRINELYARGHDQGALTPLLALYAMHIAWGTFSRQGDLSFYPGLKLKAKDGTNVPFHDPEVDLVAMQGKSLILVECKESADHLAYEEKASTDARQLGNLVTLADHLGASMVIYAAATQFPVDKSVLLAEVPSDASAEVRCLDGYDLLDPNHMAHPLSFPSVSDERMSKPENWEADYLDWIRSAIGNPPG